MVLHKKKMSSIKWKIKIKKISGKTRVENKDKKELVEKQEWKIKIKKVSGKIRVGNKDKKKFSGKTRCKKKSQWKNKSGK